MAFNTNEQQEAYRVGAHLRLAKNAGIINNTNVAASDTVALLKAAVLVAVMVQGASEVTRSQTTRAINQGVSLGLFTDAALLALTTADALIALTGVPAEYKARAFYD